MSDKPMAPWKREVFTRAEALDESPLFQAGVVDGYHEAGSGFALGSVHSLEEIEEWARGFVAGYRVRLQVEADRASAVATPYASAEATERR